jgi:hypothetical protein
MSTLIETILNTNLNRLERFRPHMLQAQHDLKQNINEKVTLTTASWPMKRNPPPRAMVLSPDPLP